MRPLARFFNRILQCLRPRPTSRPEDIPKKLDQESLRQAMEEARLLHAQHAVEVKTLAKGELPTLPARAAPDKE